MGSERRCFQRHTDVNRTCCMTYLEELDCNCSFIKEWKTIQSSPKECFLLRSCNQALWWREEKTTRKTQIVKCPGYICCMVFLHTLHYVHYRQWLEEQQAEDKKKLAKKQSKPKRRKDEWTTERNCVRRLSHWEAEKKSLLNRNNRKRQMIQNGTAKLRNNALFSFSTGIQSQDAKVAFLIAFKAATCLFLS